MVDSKLQISAEVLVRMKLIFSISAKMRLPIASVFFKMSMWPHSSFFFYCVKGYAKSMEK